jgi:hypothetical protein
MAWKIGGKIVNKYGKIGTIVKFGSLTGEPWIIYEGYNIPMRAMYDHIRHYNY